MILIDSISKFWRGFISKHQPQKKEKFLSELIDIGNDEEKSANNSISTEQYLENFPLTQTDSAEKSIREKALEIAWKNRDFEIDKYWQRAAYFWGFIVLLFGAYISIKNSKKGEGILTENPEFELYVILLGIIFSLSWYLVNVGSKKWQENWEGHIDALENKITGPIYKNIYSTGIFYSVSNINLVLSLSVFMSWIGLFFFFFHNSKIFILHGGEPAWRLIVPMVITLWISILLLRSGKSVFKDKDGYFFQRPTR